MTKLIGILGLGSIGQRHARNLMTLGYQVIAHDPADPMTHDEEFVIREADAVIIASPSKYHMSTLIEVCGGPHGKPALVEKPIAWDAPPELVRGFIDGAAYNKTPIMVGYNLRFHHCVKRLKEIVDNGEIGEIKSADLRVLQKNTKYTDPVVLNWSHEIDLANYLFGAPELLHSISKQDECYLSMQNERCPDTDIRLDYKADPEVRSGVIIGTDGMATYDLVARTVTVNDKIETFSDNWDQNYLDEMVSFLAVLDGYPSSVIATGRDGYNAYRIAYEAINGT